MTAWANTEKGFRTPRSLDEKLKRINSEELTLLEKCLRKNKPDLLDKATLVDNQVLVDSVINEMREAVGTELLNEVFEKDGSPNEYGLHLEEVIDILSHYWESQRKQLK